MKQYPIFITCRDRVEPLRQLVDWLEKVGQERIYLVDNDSTYDPLLEYFKETPHTVLYLGGNYGHRAIWENKLYEVYAKDEYYAATDFDVVPVEECPYTALEHFEELLKKYPTRTKVGFGLKVDDIPDTWLRKDPIMNWENHLWNDSHQVEPGVYDCPIDTTFALYQKNSDFEVWNTFRTGYPYVTRHLPWYTDTMHPTPEEIYYATHASGSSSWSMQQLEDWEKYGVDIS